MEVLSVLSGLVLCLRILFCEDIRWGGVNYPRDQNKLEAVEAEAKQLREAAKEHAEKLEATGGETESLRDQVCALVDGIIL